MLGSEFFCADRVSEEVETCFGRKVSNDILHEIIRVTLFIRVASDRDKSSLA